MCCNHGLNYNTAQTSQHLVHSTTPSLSCYTKGRLLQPNLSRGMHAGKEVSVNMEYNRQVAVGGAVAAEAAKAKGTTADQRDMAFATVTLAEKDNNGQQKSSNVGSAALVPLYARTLLHASLTTCPTSFKTFFVTCGTSA